MMRAIGEQVEKNPEYLSILEKEAIKNGKIDDKTQVEQVSVMNKLLNEALRAKGYKGAEIKMVLTDVEDPNGPYYTDTLTNTVVFDRKKLANSNRDKILNALGHEFGHYSKEDDIDKSQDISNYTGDLLENRTKGMVAKEATEDTLAAIRNNKNVITGEEGKRLAESIPEDRREYKVYLMARDVNILTNQRYNIGKKFAHTSIVVIPDKQEDFFDKNGNLKEEYIKLGYFDPKNFDNKLGWVVGGFNGEEDKGEPKGKLVIRINDTTDVGVFNKINNKENNTLLNGEILKEITYLEMTDTELINAIMKNSMDYQKNTNYEKYFPIPIHFKGYNEEVGEEFNIKYGYNCNSLSNTILKNIGIVNPFENIDTKRSIPGKNVIVPFKRGEQ